MPRDEEKLMSPKEASNWLKVNVRDLKKKKKKITHDALQTLAASQQVETAVGTIERKNGDAPASPNITKGGGNHVRVRKARKRVTAFLEDLLAELTRVRHSPSWYVAKENEHVLQVSTLNLKDGKVAGKAKLVYKAVKSILVDSDIQFVAMPEPGSKVRVQELTEYIEGDAELKPFVLAKGSVGLLAPNEYVKAVPKAITTFENALSGCVTAVYVKLKNPRVRILFVALHRPHTNHDQHNYRDQFLSRVEQLYDDMMNAGKVDLLIIAGDFNFNQHHPERDAIKKRLERKWEHFPKNDGKTAETVATGNATSIDRIAWQNKAENRGLRVELVGELVASDYSPKDARHKHYPMMIRLRVSFETD